MYLPVLLFCCYREVALLLIVQQRVSEETPPWSLRSVSASCPSCSVRSHDARLSTTLLSLTAHARPPLLDCQRHLLLPLPPAPPDTPPSVSVPLPLPLLLLTCRWRPWSASLTGLWGSTSQSSPPLHPPPCTPTARRVPSPPAPPTLTLCSR